MQTTQLSNTGLQEAKSIVRRFHTALDAAQSEDIAKVMAAFCAPDLIWRGYHPFNLLTGPGTVADRFWQPLKASLTALQRRDDVFFAGLNEIDGFQGTWVVSMGHLMGLFDRPWLGIRPNRKLTMLRYCCFHRVEGGQIIETAMYFDIPHLMMQAGLTPFPPQTGSPLVQPGPMTHDGLLFDPQSEIAGNTTLALINSMISDLGQWALGLPLEQELARTWHDDMIWWGPAGIGATYTIPRYAAQHSGPFRAGFENRSSTGHLARTAEGAYGGFFGWPNFTAEPSGGFMGMPATGRVAEFRVIDIYRRDGDKLAENWIFIDMLHAWMTQGVDILARTTEIER